MVYRNDLKAGKLYRLVLTPAAAKGNVKVYITDITREDGSHVGLIGHGEHFVFLRYINDVTTISIHAKLVDMLVLANAGVIGKLSLWEDEMIEAVDIPA